MTTFATMNFAPRPQTTDPYVHEARQLFHADPDQREAAVSSRLNRLPEELRPAANTIGVLAVESMKSQISITSVPPLLRTLDLLGGVDLTVGENQLAIEIE